MDGSNTMIPLGERQDQVGYGHGMATFNINPSGSWPTSAAIAHPRASLDDNLLADRATQADQALPGPYYTPSQSSPPRPSSATADSDTHMADPSDLDNFTERFLTARRRLPLGQRIHKCLKFLRHRDHTKSNGGVQKPSSSSKGQAKKKDYVPNLARVLKEMDAGEPLEKDDRKYEKILKNFQRRDKAWQDKDKDKDVVMQGVSSDLEQLRLEG